MPGQIVLARKAAAALFTPVSPSVGERVAIKCGF